MTVIIIILYGFSGKMRGNDSPSVATAIIKDIITTKHINCMNVIAKRTI